MKFTVRPTAQLIALAAQKAIRLQRREVRIYLPSSHFPEIKAYRWTRVEDPNYGEVLLFPYPTNEGGWCVRVKFKAALFNPALPKEGAEILKKIQKQ
jgi:hypothetical protein